MSETTGTYAAPSLTGPDERHSSRFKRQIGRLLPPRLPPPLPKRIRAMIYARFSSKGQHESSIERQFELGEEYARRKDFDVVGKHADRAKTGLSRVGREGLERVLAAAAAGLVDVVIVEDVDRVARREGDGFFVKEELEFHGVELHDLNGRPPDFAFAIKVGVAAEIVRKTKLRTSIGRRMLVQSGLSPHRPKFGLRRTNRKGLLELHPDRIPAVREIFDRYAHGVGRARIARDLTGRFPTPGDCRLIDDRRASPTIRSPWTVVMVREILRATVYVGVIYDGKTKAIYDRDRKRTGIELRPSEEWTEGDAPRLRVVDDETWLKANARLSDDGVRRARSTDGRRAAGPADGVKTYLLRGIASCAGCGRPMRVSYRANRANSVFECGGTA